MIKTGDRCPVCAKGILTEQTITEDFEYKGHKLSIPNYHVFSCDNCSEEIVNPKSIRATEKKMTDFRRGIDGLLTSDEIKDIRKKLGKTQKQLASMLEVGEKTFARYENGQVSQSKAMDILLRVINVNPSVLEEIHKQTGIDYEVFSTVPVPCCKECDSDIKYDLKAGTEEDIDMRIEVAA